MTRWRIPDKADLSAIGIPWNERLTEEQLSAIKANIKAKSRKVVFGTGALQDDATKARARNAQRLKSSPGARGARGATQTPPKAQERGKPTPGKPKLREAQVLRACMDLLKASPKVTLYWRQNTGAMMMAGRYLKFSFPGASDLMGVMTGTGKFLAVECKATGKRPTDDQLAFLGNVANAGGYSICVDDPAYLAAWLAEI